MSGLGRGGGERQCGYDGAVVEVKAENRRRRRSECDEGVAELH